jgi:phytoene synthase
MSSRRPRPSAIAERRLDHDRRVALEQLPRPLKPAFSALWNLDLAFADVVATSSDPQLGAIRLAWWREQLEQLDERPLAPAEPRLGSVASELLPRGVAGKELSQLEDAWLPLLASLPWSKVQVEALRLRGRILFAIGSRLLGAEPQAAEVAGELWSLIDGAQHCTDEQSQKLLCAEARTLRLPRSAPSELRPLTILAALAVTSALHPSSGFVHGVAAVRHRLTGHFPRF